MATDTSHTTTSSRPGSVRATVTQVVAAVLLRDTRGRFTRVRYPAPTPTTRRHRRPRAVFVPAGTQLALF